MGIRPNGHRPAIPAEGACLPGHHHEAVPVNLIVDGTTVAHICKHCMVRLVGLRPPGAAASATMWLPYSDDGQPLPILPNPVHRSRR